MSAFDIYINNKIESNEINTFNSFGAKFKQPNSE